MKSSKLTKKIISGVHKGKTIELPSKESTRSSKAIIVESLFNTLQFDIVDANFVEVFAGSGSIGLEALSRGAKRLFFMEKDRDAFKTLQKNIRQTNPNQCETFLGDSFENVLHVIKRLQHLKEDAYFYIDPPFSYREGMEDIYDKSLKLIENLPKQHVKLIIIEHMSSLELPETIGIYKLKKRKKFGKTSLSYFEFDD